MLKVFAKPKKATFLFCLLFFMVSFCQASGGAQTQDNAFVHRAPDGGEPADNPQRSPIPDVVKDIWDPARYIAIDEIEPGMDAYCLTCYKGTEVEKFGLKVLDVVRDVSAGRDMILVEGTDERFIHTGPVGGCSGSPVYIEGRLAGALAYGWLYSKDPLYGATPIAEMLRVGRLGGFEQSQEETGFVFDFSRPIDFAEIDRQIKGYKRMVSERKGRGLYSYNLHTLAPLPCPLVTCGLPAQVAEQLDASVSPFGFMVVSGVGSQNLLLESQNAEDEPERPGLVSGASLAVPVVTGDIMMAVVGTATEVVGEKVYGYGHGFLGYGQIDLPIATAQVHTVVSSIVRSFKFSRALDIVGALRRDESTGVYGQIGAEARMIPLTIKVDRYNDSERRVYNCRLCDNRVLTPDVLGSAVAGACLQFGQFPPEHTVRYKATIEVEGGESIVSENVSTGSGPAELLMESVGSVTLLMNNPFAKVDIKSVDFEVGITEKNIFSHIWSVDLSDSVVKPGQTVDISVILESVRAEKKRYNWSLRVPDDLGAGKYELIVTGWRGYLDFLKEAVPYRFVAQSVPSLIESINDVLAIKRDKLYFLLVLPAGGVAVEREELPDLPATKVLVLQDAKRTLKIRPFQHWLENIVETGTVVIDKKIMRITVEK